MTNNGKSAPRPANEKLSSVKGGLNRIKKVFLVVYQRRINSPSIAEIKQDNPTIGNTKPYS